jgi:hypothetical protein
MGSAAGADEIDPTTVRAETVVRMARDTLRRIVELLDGFQERYGSARG